MIESGEAGSMGKLARTFDVDRSYVSRMLKLTSVAPDTVEAVLHGDEPEGINLRELQKGLPVSWQEQRERWSRRR